MLHGCRLNPPMFLGAKWPRLLDAAETAKLFGLVPQGELDKADVFAVRAQGAQHWWCFYGKSMEIAGDSVIGLMIFGKNMKKLSSVLIPFIDDDLLYDLL